MLISPVRLKDYYFEKEDTNKLSKTSSESSIDALKRLVRQLDGVYEALVELVQVGNPYRNIQQNYEIKLLS